MEIENLNLIGRAKGLSQSELAKMAGVTRQAVSLWFSQGGFVNITSGHMRRLAQRLHVTADELLFPLPEYSPKQRAQMRARYLWDGLFPNLESFLLAIANHQARALARLVDKEGIFAAAHIVGDVVWREFTAYSRYLPPVRRRGLEQLWHHHRHHQ